MQNQSQIEYQGVSAWRFQLMGEPGAEPCRPVIAMTTICSSWILARKHGTVGILPGVERVTDEPPVFSPSQMSRARGGHP